MDGLERARLQIDEIDAQIVRLFERRMDAVQAVADYKRAHNLPVLQSNREEQVLARAAALLQNPRREAALRRVFETLMAVSRQAQNAQNGAETLAPAPLAADARLVYPGCEGSFSEQAARAFFGPERPAEPLDTFEEAARAVASGRADASILPIENTTTGSVIENYDLLQKYNLCIVGEAIVRVTHNLLGAPGASIEDIRQVHSHPQALLQCQAFLGAHPIWRLIGSSNTALSARAVAENGDRGVAAIASLRAAEKYGLEVLARGIETEKQNFTRFVAVARQGAPGPADKASVVFTLDNRPGALAAAIACFARHGVNMSKLESRPRHERPWEYAFYADLDWDRDAGALQAALDELAECATSLRPLGLYRRAAGGKTL